MTRLVNSFGDKYYIGNSYNGGGFGYIKKNIKGFNEAAIGAPFFVLTDLDNVDCPIILIKDWLKHEQRPNLLFRVAVREVESWLLADIEGFANFLGISTAHFPLNPDALKSPKKELIALANKSRKRDVKEDIIPINQNAKIGPNYNGRLMDFVFGGWSINRAIVNSESLSRTYNCLNKFEYVVSKAISKKNKNK